MSPDDSVLKASVPARRSILVATGNAGKAREFREMLGGDQYEWSDLANIPNAPDVEETGDTFRANACLKASAYARFANRWSLADDSGLIVDALGADRQGGKPGVYSARWAAMHNVSSGNPKQKDADNNALLLKQLENVPDDQRAARFVCVLALSDPEGNIVLTTRGTVEGTLLRAPRGAGGFGYDPLFLITALNKTTAELSASEKHAISHRGNALRTLKRMMEERGL